MRSYATVNFGSSKDDNQIHWSVLAAWHTNFWIVFSSGNLPHMYTQPNWNHHHLYAKAVHSPRQKLTWPIKFCKIIPVGYWKSRLLLLSIMDWWIIGQLILGGPTQRMTHHAVGLHMYQTTSKRMTVSSLPRRKTSHAYNLISTNSAMLPW